MTTENTFTITETQSQVFSGIPFIDNLVKFQDDKVYTFHCTEQEVQDNIAFNLAYNFNKNGVLANLVEVAEFCDCHRDIENVIDSALGLYDNAHDEEYEFDEDEDYELPFFDVVIIKDVDTLMRGNYSNPELTEAKQEIVDALLPNCGLIIFLQPSFPDETNGGINLTTTAIPGLDFTAMQEGNAISIAALEWDEEHQSFTSVIVQD